MGTVHAKNNVGPNITSVDTSAGCDSVSSKKVNLEGVEARVDKITVEGLQRTKDDIVIETVREMFQSQDFQEVIVNAHRVKEKLENLGCFQNIGIFIDTSTGADATLNGLEVTFNVKELKRMIGGANTMVGNNEGSLVVSLRAPNMFGRGESLRAEYSYGSRRTNNLSLSFLKPLRTKYDALFTTSIFQQGSDWPWSGYKIVERGILFDLGFNSTCNIRHNLQYEGAWREMGTSSRSSAFDVREGAGHKIKSSIRHILTLDKRDAPIFPSRGSLFRTQVSLFVAASSYSRPLVILITCDFGSDSDTLMMPAADKAGGTSGMGRTFYKKGIGGDIKFLKNDFAFQYNIPLFYDMVIQATLQGGHLLPLGDNESVGLPDKMFIGGPTSVRGFQTRGIGPHSDGNATGSNIAWGAGLHLYTPLPFIYGRGGFGDLFRVHFFTNLGQCKDVDFNRGIGEGVTSLLDQFRMSLGLGLALRLGQLARVEFNYVFPNIVQDGDVALPGFQFGVGLQFL